MSSDYLDRYAWEAQAHANELLDLYDHEEREGILKQFRPMWNDFLEQTLPAPSKSVFVFLGEGPTARDRRLAKLDYGSQVLLWLQARYLALEAARALEIAASVENLSGPYRRAARHAAQAALQARDLPTAEELLLLRLPD